MINVLYFARLRDQLNCANEQLALEAEQISVAQIKELLAARGEPWCSVMQDSNLLVAVNQTLVDSQAAVQAGDEVGFFPPVTGG